MPGTAFGMTLRGTGGEAYSDFEVVVFEATAPTPHAGPHTYIHPSRGSACHSSMRPGGTHSRLAAGHVLRNLRAREPPGHAQYMCTSPGGSWVCDSPRWADYSDEAVAAADTNRDGHISEHELVALCVSVGAAWPEIRVRDVLRKCL